MAALRGFLIFSICLLLGHQASARNEAPCQRSRWNNGYDTFLKRHILFGTPTSLDQNEWKNFIKDQTGCGRPTQSFLKPKDLEKVRNVCTTMGGKMHKENLCISQQAFTFVTVRSEPGTCGIKSVREETKHLILACEMLGSECLPVHFEGNPENSKPNNNAKGCQDPQIKDNAPGFRMTWLWLPVSILLLLLMDVNYFI